MAKLKQTENKLMRAGYVRDARSTHKLQIWVDATPDQGSDIGFWTSDDFVVGSFKVAGRNVRALNVDDFFSSTYVYSLAEAIRTARS